MEKILIYGYGQTMKSYLSIIRDEYDVVAITDIDDDKCVGYYEEIPLIKKTKLNSVNFDKVLVTPRLQLYSAIESVLELGINKDRIIPFFRPGYLNHNDYCAKVESDPSIAVKIILKNGLSFFLKKSTDISVFEELYLDNDYRCFINNRKDMVVIDIGMNVGLATLYFASNDRVKKVYGFEAFRPTFELARNNIYANEKRISEKIEAYNYALSDTEEEKEFDYLEDEPGNMGIVSGHIKWENRETRGHKEKVKIRMAGKEIKRIISNEGEKIYILKCDCEGAEYDVFKSLVEFNVVNKIKYIIMETHLGRGDEILKILRDNQFSYFAPVSRNGRLGMIYAINEGKDS